MLIFAHRGASDQAPENTLAAFALAIEQQADGIELDVFEHQGEFWVIHDHRLDRTTNGRGLLSDHSVAELQTLHAGNGQPIPTLKDALQLISGRVKVNIEIKGLNDPSALLTQLQQAEQNNGFADQLLLISSFNHHYLKAIHNLAPERPVGALTASLPLDYAAFASALNAWSVHIELGLVTPAFVQDAHQRGLKVLVYTVDHPQDIQRMQRYRVDGIFSNNPKQARMAMF